MSYFHPPPSYEQHAGAPSSDSRSLGASPLAPVAGRFAPGDVHGVRDTAWVGQQLTRTTFEVTNNVTYIFGAPLQLQHLIDAHTKYPTATALDQADGWRPPEASIGEYFWDGFIHLARFPVDGRPGVVPTGLLDLCTWVCDTHNFPYVVDDRRVRPMEGLPDTTPIELYDYQRVAVEAALHAGRGVIDMPPRGGKTRVAAELTRRLALPTIWIVPTSNVRDQTLAVFEDLLGPHYAAGLKGTKLWREVTHVPVVVTTAAAAQRLPPEFFQTREVLLIDEFHHAAASTYHDLIAKCGHIYFRYGMTGTFTRSGDDVLALHAVLSKVIFRITTTELLERGRIVPTKVCFLPVTGPRPKGIKGLPYQAGLGKQGIGEHEYRNALAAWAAVTAWSRKRKVLVLVSTKAQGYAIQNTIAQHVPRRGRSPLNPVEFVSTDRPAGVCRDVIEAFSASDAVEVLIGTSMVGEGTDLPPADALVYAYGMKAEVGLVQAAYRVGTAAPGKRVAILVDFADRHHSTLEEHSVDRSTVYYREQTFSVDCLEDPTFFPGWLDWQLGQV